MSRNEQVMVDRIDRRREREASREQRTARDRELEGKARRVIAQAFTDLSPDEQADFLKDLIAAGREHLVQLVDAPGAAAFLSQQAYEAGKGILPRKIAQARAEQLFRGAANDGDAG